MQPALPVYMSMPGVLPIGASSGLVGFASAGSERTGNYPYQAELYTIYMLKKYQGMGVGRQLVAGIARRLVERDMISDRLHPRKHPFECFLI